MGGAHAEDAATLEPAGDAAVTNNGGARPVAAADGGPSVPDVPNRNEDGGLAPTLPAGLWLKGDLHVHTAHSTDASDSPVADVLARAEGSGFDYLATTDHDNHVQGAITTWDDPAFTSSQLVLLYGVEWTTALGHANLFSTAPWDHLSIYALREGNGEASIHAAHAQGLHFSVNHPAAKDLWEYGFELAFDSMEVWTSVFLVPNSNDKAIELWDDILLGGRRMPARGGSDSHHQTNAESLLFNLGNPTTWVHARARTGDAVLEALAAGRISLSYAPDAERLDLTADADGNGTFETEIGDNLPAQGRPLRFRIEIEGHRSGAPYDLTVIKNGDTLMTFKAEGPSVEFEDTPLPGARSYYRVELRGDTPRAPIISGVGFGGFVGLTNPIYVGFP